MIRSSFVIVAILSLAAPAIAQDDPRHKSLRVSPKHDGKKVKLDGTVDMPDGTILTFTLSSETETMMFHKVKCKIQTIITAALRSDPIEVKGKRFSHTFDLSPGFYQYSLQYMKFAQRDEKVIHTLKPSYQDWQSNFSMILVDAKTMVERLTSERGKLQDWVKDFVELSAKVTDFVESKGDAKAWKPIEEQIQKQEKRINAAREGGSYYPCTLVVIGEGLMKMRACSPMADNMNFPPGSAEAEHMSLGTGDIPAGVNSQWNMDLIRAFAARARRTLEHERMVLPLRLAKNRWDNYVGGMRLDWDEKALDGEKALWDLAVVAAKENAELIEKELPDDKKKRKPEEKVMSDWCTKTIETLAKLDEYAVKRRAGMASSVEEKAELDEKVVKEYLQLFDALNTDVRSVPGT